MKYGNAAVRRPECGVERTMDVLGGRWTTLIVRELLGGKRRFSELRRALVRISPKTLTARLRDLEEQGVLTRTVYAEVPPRVDYTLTPRGEALGEIIAAMARWGSAGGPGTSPGPADLMPGGDGSWDAPERSERQRIGGRGDERTSDALPDVRASEQARISPE